MKKKYLVLFVLAVVSVASYAQKASVEKSTYGIQTGFLGVWAHREVKLSNEIALRAELGMDLGLWGGDFYPKSGYLLAPVIRLEPRWYYNLDKRVSKSRSISGNAGNFLSLQTSYHPNWFTISNYDNVEVVNQVSIILVFSFFILFFSRQTVNANNCVFTSFICSVKPDSVYAG